MSGKPRNDPRPLSPHLQVWRFHATMYASIFHRITGAALYFGTFLIAAWLIALATSEEAYALVESVIFSIPGQILLFLWTVAILFHFLSGIRYLLWDGPLIGFNPQTASRVSIFLFAFAILGSAAIWAATIYF